MPVGEVASDAFSCNPRQPGRADRKAEVYAAEVSGLRDAGCTCEAIREALAEAARRYARSLLAQIARA